MGNRDREVKELNLKLAAAKVPALQTQASPLIYSPVIAPVRKGAKHRGSMSTLITLEWLLRSPQDDLSEIYDTMIHREFIPAIKRTGKPYNVIVESAPYTDRGEQLFIVASAPDTTAMEQMAKTLAVLFPDHFRLDSFWNVGKHAARYDIKYGLEKGWFSDLRKLSYFSQ